MGNQPNKDLNYLDYSQDAIEGNTVQTTFRLQEISKSDKALKLKEEGKLKEALSLIDDALKDDSKNFENWNVKGLILNGLSDFEQSVKCFDNALRLNDSDFIRKNKANALYNFAKITFFPDMDYEKAMGLIDEALECLPDDEDASEYWFLKAEIFESLGQPIETRIYYLKAEGEFEKADEISTQREFLKDNEDVLITVSGTNFFKGLEPFEKGVIVNLVKQPDNEHDSDAIGVFLADEQIGYVANSPYTLIDGVKSASEIKFIEDNQKAEVLFIFLERYVILKLID
ncbi:HIRAN domain-containing protein [Methanobrevibacter sp. YE315]|uniref:HIRAN domain-containing protein n=1 Tax=Methanobrevibacter sp. YE315 TaxID=1609968 RepID=UPI00083068A2|nr:HIRAN domain-containing protein [Methanobrevibacter sp. YE315]